MKITKSLLKKLIKEELESPVGEALSGIEKMPEDPAFAEAEPEQEKPEPEAGFYVMYREHYNTPIVIGDKNGYDTLEEAVKVAEQEANRRGLKKEDTSDPRNTIKHSWWGGVMFGKVQEYRRIYVAQLK